MRRWMAAPLVFAAAMALTAASGTSDIAAQDKTDKKKHDDPTPDSVTTADGVTLRCLFHESKSENVGKLGNQVVILMYAPGGGRDMTKGDWAGLANRLNDEGYHVLRFDWRGHGKSTEIADVQSFWKDSLTARMNVDYITGSKKVPPKTEFNALKDLPGNKAAAYYPAYVNDLAAIRYLLDKKNDDGRVNTSSVYLVGAGDAATVGMMWLAGEWLRPGVYPTANELLPRVRYEFVPQLLNSPINATNAAGATVAGAVWLSPARPKLPISDAMVKGWVSRLAPRMRDTPMLFMHGEKDTAGAAAAKYFYNEVLVAEGRSGLLPKLDKTFIRDVKGTTLNGVGLLGNNAELKTEDRMVEYLGVIQKKQSDKSREPRRGFTQPYLFDLSRFVAN